MIKVYIKKNEIVIAGHADFDLYGKDIVCASVSSVVITSVNACLRIDEKALTYKEDKDKLTIKITSDNTNVLLIIENMIAMLSELAQTYNKNIKIIKED